MKSGFEPFSESVKIAYFSMEIALRADIPTYSGGLGVLAGDTLRSAADLGFPMVGVTLLYRKGYFQQKLDVSGRQTESPVQWDPARKLEKLDATTEVRIEGRKVKIAAWRFLVPGVRGHKLPVYLLDTDLPENAEEDRHLTDHLYGGDNRYRLSQEVLLGIGGTKILSQIGHKDVQVYHMNEGHSALLTLELLRQSDLNSTRKRCVFTTHTPVPAGHDRFPVGLVQEVLDADTKSALNGLNLMGNGELNMTDLALKCSRYINGVAKRHGQVSQEMFPDYNIHSITNGVHAATWTTGPLQKLFDRHVPEWRHQNMSLRHMALVDANEVARAHKDEKIILLNEIEKRTGKKLAADVFTIGFARRATAYKRADLLFHDVERLKKLAAQFGKIQIIYGGKAHPRDDSGKELIAKIFKAGQTLASQIPVVYVEEYDMDIAYHICAGVDLWLNNPEKPREASGTSGMKAALNGVPSLSVLDGWWIEGCLEGVTGWSIGDASENSNLEAEAASLYEKLERDIVPMYYKRPEEYARVRLNAIAMNGSFFNTERMVLEYLDSAYCSTPD